MEAPKTSFEKMSNGKVRFITDFGEGRLSIQEMTKEQAGLEYLKARREQKALQEKLGQALKGVRESGEAATSEVLAWIELKAKAEEAGKRLQYEQIRDNAGSMLDGLALQIKDMERVLPELKRKKGV